MAQGFDGFPALAKSTAIPNVYFATLLPEIEEPSELLTFLWVQRLCQGQTGDVRFTTADDLWASDAVRRSFERIGGGRDGLTHGLDACVSRGALLSLPISSAERGSETIFMVNTPGSRRTVVRVRAGELRLRPGAALVQEPETRTRPSIFSLYEEHIGTITPFVGERLAAAEERYPRADIESAFREAAELNVRNWRYIERMLERWEREGRADGANRGDSLEERKRRFLASDERRTAR